MSEPPTRVAFFLGFCKDAQTEGRRMSTSWNQSTKIGHAIPSLFALPAIASFVIALVLIGVVLVLVLGQGP